MLGGVSVPPSASGVMWSTSSCAAGVVGGEAALVAVAAAVVVDLLAGVGGLWGVASGLVFALVAWPVCFGLVCGTSRFAGGGWVAAC